MSEAAILRQIMLRIGARPDATIFRNNTGVAVHPDGSRVVYGLCRGSADLVGWRRHVVTEADVGRTLARFLAIEVKAAGGRATPEQRRFLEAVARAGGLSFVARSADEAASHLDGGLL